MTRFNTSLAVLLVLALAPCEAVAVIGTTVAPWQALAGRYDSSVNDGRILGFPAPTADDPPFFFELVGNAILTMTADNGGLSRSAVGVDPSAPVPFALGDAWENANGGRGFTNWFCGGYEALGCADVKAAIPEGADALGILLGGPIGSMDSAQESYSPKDVASSGWPAALLADLPAMHAAMPEMCLAPQGAPDAQANFCASGLTYRTGNAALYVSPDAGRQFYPISSSCGLPWLAGPDLVAADPAQPGHVVTANLHGDAGGCESVTYTKSKPSACNVRAIAWTGDVSEQVKASILATAPATPGSPPPAGTATYDVDKAGLPASDNVKTDPGGWRYAALGHLALGASCDAQHAGIQLGCVADTKDWCHTNRPADDQSDDERFCPDYANAACKCKDENGFPIDETACTFPAITSLAIDPRGGQVYAPSNVGLLYSPDGGRKWRRHGHSGFTRYGADSLSGTAAQTAEAWPYYPQPSEWVPGEDPGIRILTLQGLPLPALPMPDWWAANVACDLNAQPELVTHLSKVSFATVPCEDGPPPGQALLAEDAMGFLRPRVRVVSVLAATWQNPLKQTQVLSGVFVAHGDSCSDEHARLPLVFHDSANTTPITYRAAGNNTVNREPWPI